MSKALSGAVRKILADTESFKAFWQHSGPYKYALTSSEYPPVLLEDEEWIFSNEMTSLLKELMQFDQNKMKIIKAPFNAKNTKILRPDGLSEWRIQHFPKEWNLARSKFFVPEGHLTDAVPEAVDQERHPVDAAIIGTVFFKCLEKEIEKLGYRLFKPRDGSRRAAIQSYLKEWEKDEQDAGII